MTPVDSHLPPVTVVRPAPDLPAVIRIDPPGGESAFAWVLTSAYAREMAILLLGAAVAAEMLNGDRPVGTEGVGGG